MLTDDQLSRDLGDAFRAASEGVTYTGRRQPPRSTAPVALSIGAAAVVVAGAIGVVIATDEQAAPPAGAAPAAVPEPPRAMVGDSISLAGVTLRYEREVGSPDPLRERLDVDAPPDDATPVPLPGTEAQAWVGVDPESGDNALYLQAPTRNGGRLFALLSPTWTQDQLVELLRNGTPD
jgi:hypothetical protein